MTEEEIKEIKDRLNNIEETIQNIKALMASMNDKEAQLQIRVNAIENNIKKLNLGFPIL